MSSNPWSRRQVLKGALGAMAASAWPLGALAATPPRKPLGVALVGLGGYSEGRLAPALQLTKHCRLAGIVTGTPAKAKAWQARYQLPDRNIYDYDNFASIADNPDIDVVYVVLPNSLHGKYTIAAAEAGKHVWCEKPMAMNAAEAQRMIDACNRNKVKLAIGYRMHHEPNTRRIISWVDEKPYGAIRRVRAEAGFSAFDEDSRGNWRLDPARGGGAMYDMGVYALNGARYATGLEPVAVSARHETRRPQIFTGVDETTRFTLEFPGGIVGDCATSFGINMNQLHVDCERGWYELAPFQSYDGIKGRTSDGKVLDARVQHQQALQMDEDALAIMQGTPLRAPGEEGLADMRVMDAIFASAKAGGKKVTIAG
ncbi:glucose-fructose oxidoreductase [Stenotrophomonas panacihumi]|uniref:Glucose-fructose oxidoreductase n=1 Tax=Stenotrophomonas panacihumi TaxID=676599 RepID=A0A0R0APV7_9GAMM|nr:glucose-fructose oxidoreductase [Stenotrophomonas panacihumi]PTN55216.1 gfo/Idh/MocA family oxidoreductase [Stenotrophomonas panacihumi]